ncbi:MAG: hypothetical protein LBU36_02240 [Clostridiales bacterium]|nr:hypothetical protein [Clostridiales bacterium]
MKTTKALLMAVFIAVFAAAPVFADAAAARIFKNGEEVRPDYENEVEFFYDYGEREEYISGNCVSFLFHAATQYDLATGAVSSYSAYGERNVVFSRGLVKSREGVCFVPLEAAARSFGALTKRSGDAVFVYTAEWLAENEERSVKYFSLYGGYGLIKAEYAKGYYKSFAESIRFVFDGGKVYFRCAAPEPLPEGARFRARVASVPAKTGGPSFSQTEYSSDYPDGRIEAELDPPLSIEDVSRYEIGIDLVDKNDKAKTELSWIEVIYPNEPRKSYISESVFYGKGYKSGISGVFDASGMLEIKENPRGKFMENIKGFLTGAFSSD